MIRRALCGFHLKYNKNFISTHTLTHTHQKSEKEKFGLPRQAQVTGASKNNDKAAIPFSSHQAVGSTQYARSILWTRREPSPRSANHGNNSTE